MSKVIFVAGGVFSGTGKGVAAASVALLLKRRGHNVGLLKLDPYLNVDAGIIKPTDHGEVFITDDGCETDLDLGTYSRIAQVEVGADNILTAGTLMKELIEEQERGDFLGQTVQITPHATNKIISRVEKLRSKHDVVIVEVGGTVGDAEGAMFYRAIAQIKTQLKNDCLICLVSPILWAPTIKEWKTKPLQRSVVDLQSYGIQPEILLCRVERAISTKILDKIASLTCIPREHVIEAPDASSLYEVPIEFYKREVDDFVVDLLGLKRSGCRIKQYREILERYSDEHLPLINVGVVGKYENADEAYISIREALFHAGLANRVKVNTVWLNAESIEVKDLKNFDAIIIPGGFDKRGAENKIEAIRFARENKIPFLGICLGLQCAVIECARNLAGMTNANSQEFDKNTDTPVVSYLEGQLDIPRVRGTMRLGAYECILKPSTMAAELYGKLNISERHRHRLEVSPEYVETLESNGFVVSGTHPGTGLVEIMERKDHPFFIATQAHPEFQSYLTTPSPLFWGLVKASAECKGVVIDAST